MAIEEQRRERVLAWEACANARDLGGYPTHDGQETAWGRIVRSDTPSRLTEAGRASLAAYGIRTVIDLRMTDEIQRDPTPFAGQRTRGAAVATVLRGAVVMRDGAPLGSARGEFLPGRHAR